jgi:hypothetical protein
MMTFTFASGSQGSKRCPAIHQPDLVRFFIRRALCGGCEGAAPAGQCRAQNMVWGGVTDNPLLPRSALLFYIWYFILLFA